MRIFHLLAAAVSLACMTSAALAAPAPAKSEGINGTVIRKPGSRIDGKPNRPVGVKGTAMGKKR